MASIFAEINLWFRNNSNFIYDNSAKLEDVVVASALDDM